MTNKYNETLALIKYYMKKIKAATSHTDIMYALEKIEQLKYQLQQDWNNRR